MNIIALKDWKIMFLLLFLNEKLIRF